MCNRYRIEDPDALERYIREVFGPELKLPGPRYNIAPNQEAPIVAADASRKLVAFTARWNLVPASSNPDARFLRTNARSEDVLAKPSFRGALQARRCLVPADAFYEWEHLAGGRVKFPWAFERAGGGPFTLAGIWEAGAAERPPSFAILTTAPNALVARIHDRMPVMLADDDARRWVEPGAMTPEQLAVFTRPFPPARMQSHRVNPALNSVRNDSAEAAAPYVEPSPDDFRLASD